MREISVPAQRTFTGSDLIPVVARGRATTNPRAIPFEYHDGDRWRPVSNAELVERVDKIAAGLIASGVGRRPGGAHGRNPPRMGPGRPRRLDRRGHHRADHPSSSAGQLEWILDDSRPVLVAENESHVVVVGDASIPDTCTRILYIDDGALDTLGTDGEAVEAENPRRRAGHPRARHPGVDHHTSGTTGRPKGCVITHRNLLSECHALLDHPIGSMAQQGKKTLMFLPWPTCSPAP